MAVTLAGAPDDQTPPTTPPTDSPPSAESDSPVGLTAEEVDSRWRHRVSQKDKAHAAAETALREEIETLRRQQAAASQAPSNGQAGGGDNLYREQLAQKDRELEEERRLRTIEGKKAKYPALAKQVGASGDSVFNSDDATLARLNALAEDDPAVGTFASTTPRRTTPAPPKDLNSMSKAELEQELKRSVERGMHNR